MVVGNGTGGAIDQDCDVFMVETMAMHSQVLVPTGETFIRTDVKDNWNIECSVASTIVISTVKGLGISNHGITNFPEHLEVHFGTNWHLTDLTRDSVVSPPRIPGG